MDDLTSFKRDLLFVVADSDGNHGLWIKEQMEEYYAGEIHHGRLYPNLDELVEMGFVEKGTIDKRTNSYEITDRGLREIEARHEWEQKWLNGNTEQPAN